MKPQPTNEQVQRVPHALHDGNGVNLYEKTGKTEYILIITNEEARKTNQVIREALHPIKPYQWLRV